MICVSDPEQYQLISVRISAYDTRKNVDIFQPSHHLTYSPKREEIGDAKYGQPRLDLPSFFHRHHLTGLRLKTCRVAVHFAFCHRTLLSSRNAIK